MNRTRTSAALAILALLAPGCFLWPQPRGTADRPTIVEFDIEGAHALSSGELIQHLATQPSGRKYLIVPEPRRLDADAFETDQRRIVRYYQAHGYYQARIASAEVVPVEPGKVRLHLEVVEGPPVRVTQVEVTGIEEAPEARRRAGELPLREGDIFTEEAFDAGRTALLAALGATGWPKAEVAQGAQVDPTLNEAHVTYAVTPGERYRFGPIFVAGAAAIPRARIREQAELAVEPGKTFDTAALPRAQARVYDLGVFGGVRVSQGPVDEKKQQIPVVVSVREAPFRTIRAGPGFELQLTRWELDAIVGWSHRDWLGGLRKLNLDARIGYAWIPNFLNPVKRGWVGLASADFTQPSIATRYVDLNVRTELERGLEPAYDFWAQRLRIGTPFKLGRVFTFVPSVNAELYELGGQVTAADQQTGQVLTLSTCPGRDPALCLLSYFEQRLAVDFRDDPINTTKGFYLAFAVQEGFSLAGNGSPYLRFLPEARAFASLPLGFVLAGRARVGIVEPLSTLDVPIVARFTSGGPTYMRGYYNRDLSPVLATCPDPKAVSCPGTIQYVPVGGAGLLDGSVELRFPIAGQLGGATFLDFGNVRLKATEAVDPKNLQYAVGVGLRYKTVFGPLRVDLAGRLPRPSGGQPGVQVVGLRATEGGTRTEVYDTGVEHHAPIVSFHLSVGEAF